MLILFSVLVLFACKKKQSELVWNQSFFRIGSQSSPRTADLNQDDVLDIVMGAAAYGEMVPTKQGVLAIDGQNGELIWQQEANASVVGSASFQDINNDGVPEVFIGGRGSFLAALDGQTGKEIWKYEYQYANDSILQYAWYNFYNSVWVPDQNGDNLLELLTVNGGNFGAAAGSTDNRYPGVLMLFDSKTGEILAADTMPDGHETYMSPLCYQDSNSNEWNIVFGSGGETMGGSLYVCSLQDLLDQKIANARIIATEKDHGFIAPPVLADLNQDGNLDIIAISHASNIFAIDGQTLQPMWKQEFPGMESSNGFGVGHFTNRERVEILAVMDRGTWPQYTDAHQVLLDGASGSILYRDSIGCFVVSAPVVYDLDHDGYDEAILNINNYQCETEIVDNIPNPPKMTFQLIAMDFQNNSHQVIDFMDGFRNIFSTPWIGDIDNSGYLDIIYCAYNHPDDLKQYLGMSVKRIRTPIKMKRSIKWGAYMGTYGDGTYK
jgi:outer membrane protein assembly factor BamB